MAADIKKSVLMLMLQTEDEKQLRKMVRRDEKKLTRRKDADREVIDSAKVSFNPQELLSRRSVIKLCVL